MEGRDGFPAPSTILRKNLFEFRWHQTRAEMREIEDEDSIVDGSGLGGTTSRLHDMYVTAT